VEIALDADALFGFAIMLSVPAYFVVQPWALLSFKRGWRLAAAAPLALSIPAALWCLIALSQDSNLWPMVFILFAPFGTGYLLVLAWLRSVSR
jgi:hypothetical protein